jgi:signal transduction histidine kinase
MAVASFVCFVFAGILQSYTAAGGHPLTVAMIAFPLPYLAFAVVGALVVWRLPNHRLGWLMCFTGLSLLLGLALITPGMIFDRLPGEAGLAGAALYLVGHSLTTVAFGLIVLLLLLFPSGSPSGRLQQALLIMQIVAPILVLLANIIDDPVLYGDEAVRNPFHLPWRVPVLSFLDSPASFATFGLALSASALSIGLRYRRSDHVARLQIKWFMFAVVGAGLFTLADGLIQARLRYGSLPEQIATVLYSAAWVAAVAAIGVAIVRYRLWAIDLLVSRALTYGVLFVLIAVVYGGVLLGLGTLVGQAAGLPLALAVTIAIAIAFQPARERLQRLANQIVYGHRAPPYQVLADFTERVAHTLQAAEVAPLMARVLAEGTGARSSAVWIHRKGEMELAATWPSDQEAPSPESATRTVPVSHEGMPLGRLALWRTGEGLSRIEQKLMDDLARQAGVVLRGVMLDEELRSRLKELQASRRRLVEAQDRERRRLERDIHDGAQQQLVALSVSLEAETSGDPEQVARLEALRVEAVSALEMLRELSRGLAPPVLESQGLEGALASLARRAPIPVEVEANVGRFGPEVEMAVYYCCAEALQNVAKHASARHASIRVNTTEGGLRFEVTDDGRGFDGAVSGGGSGLQNMRDRLGALGGELEVRTGAHGSTVAGSLPC